MKTYAGTFLVAFTTLALQVTLTRLLSVITWYHLSFFAIALAMLGMTAAAVTIYLNPARFPQEQTEKSIVRACFGYALSVPVTLIVLSLLRVDVAFANPLMELISLIVATVAIFLPFYFSGMAISLILTRATVPIGRLYASDLGGAALGALFVLGGLELFDAPSLILLCGAVGALAGFIFAMQERDLRRQMILLAVALVALGVANTLTRFNIRPMFVKGSYEVPASLFYEEWNSFSRVAVYNMHLDEPQLWGASPLAPTEPILQHAMNIDGEAGTTVRPFASEADLEHLRYDVTNLAYYLRPAGGAFIIGVGGGRDVQSAVLFGHERIVGIDVNPIFINLLQNQFRDFAGLADLDHVTLVVGEGRGYLSSHEDAYAVVQMSLIDTWAATGAGAFTLSENSLYTTEAWHVFMDRLAEDGIFTVSRWYNPDNLGETARIVSLAAATLMESGVEDPAQHIAMAAVGSISTLLVSKNPLSDADLDTLRQVTGELQYTLAILPGEEPENPVLREILSARSIAELNASLADERFNYTPPTDENPYFFNMLKLSSVGISPMGGVGVIGGNLVATLTLVLLIAILVVMVLATIIIPLSARRRRTDLKTGTLRQMLPGALYFSMIGAGFMLLEIALIQRLSVFLSHPTYALGVLLFTIILSTGVGSYLSERLPLTRTPWVYVYPVATVVAILVVRFSLAPVLGALVEAPLLVKALVSVIVIAPMGVLMGFFFPTGMRLVKATNQVETPWYWALNGVFGVLCSALAVFISIFISVSTNFYLAAGCYALVLIALYQMQRAPAVESAAPLVEPARAEA